MVGGCDCRFVHHRGLGEIIIEQGGTMTMEYHVKTLKNNNNTIRAESGAVM